jgi:hypothetical protein
MTVLLVLAPGVSAHAGERAGGARYQLTHMSEDDPVDLNGDRWTCATVAVTDSNRGGQGTSLVIDDVLTQ